MWLISLHEWAPTSCYLCEEELVEPLHTLPQVLQRRPENNKVVMMGHINEPVPTVWKDMRNCFQIAGFHSSVSHFVLQSFSVSCAFLPKKSMKPAPSRPLTGILWNFFSEASQSSVVTLTVSKVWSWRSDSALPCPSDLRSLPAARIWHWMFGVITRCNAPVILRFQMWNEREFLDMRHQRKLKQISKSFISLPYNVCLP